MKSKRHEKNMKKIYEEQWKPMKSFENTEKQWKTIKSNEENKEKQRKAKKSKNKNK